MNNRNLYIGSVFVIMGVIWMLKNFGLIDYSVFDVVFSWQMALVAVGGYLLVLRKWVLGIILGLAGLVFLAQLIFNFYIPLNKIIIPAILITAGVSIALQKR